MSHGGASGGVEGPRCPGCFGGGTVLRRHGTARVIAHIEEPCPQCAGQGVTLKQLADLNAEMLATQKVTNTVLMELLDELRREGDE